MPTEDALSLVYPLNEFCRIFGISRSKAYRDLSSGKLKAKKLGTRTMITAESAAEYRDSLPDYVPRSST